MIPRVMIKEQAREDRRTARMNKNPSKATCQTCGQSYITEKGRERQRKVFKEIATGSREIDTTQLIKTDEGYVYPDDYGIYG